MESHSDKGELPTSEVGCGGPNQSEEIISENTQKSSGSNVPESHNLLSGMESIFTRLLAATQAPVQHNSTQLIKFDPDDPEADIEGWCKITEIIVTSRKLAGADLLLTLIHSLKGRAATCLTKLQISDIEWPQIKQILLAKFSKPMLMQDYFDNIMRFQIGSQETAPDAALRLWNHVERIPRADMPEYVIAGFVISVLCQRDAMIRRELNTYTITTRAQLCRILSGISIKRRHENNDGSEVTAKKSRIIPDARFAGSCHYCGNRGHKAEDCRKRRENLARSKPAEREKTITCFACGKIGHLSSSCPEKNTGREQSSKKEVNVCERRWTRGDVFGGVLVFARD